MGIDFLKTPRSAIAQIAHMGAALATTNLLGGAIGLATSLVIARGLGRDEFGRWTFFMAAVTAVTGAFDLGFGVLLTRDAARSAVGPLLSGALATRLTLFLPLGLLVYAGAPTMTIGAVSPAAIRVGVFLAAAGISYSCVAAVFRASPRKLLAILIVEVLGAGARFGGAAVIVQRAATIRNLAVMVATVQIAQLLAAFTLWRAISPHNRLQRPSFASSWTMLRRAFPFALTGLVANAQSRIAPLMLGTFSNAGETASFGVALRIGNAARRVPQAALTVGMPVFAREVRQRESARPTFDRLLAWFGIAAAVALVAFATPMVTLTYGPMFVAAAPALAWTGIGLLPWLLNNSRKMHLYASGREHIAVRWSAATLAVQAVGCALLIPGFGARGAAIALALGEAAAWLPLRVAERASQ